MIGRRVVSRCGLVAALAQLAGCQTSSPPLYVWGGYDAAVHDREWRPDAVTVDDQIMRIEADRDTAAARGAALPPGWRIHLAMLYNIRGDTDRARELLGQEKQVFPESTRFVDMLLEGLRPGSRP